VLAKSPSPFFLPYKKEVPGKKYVGISRITIIKTVTINV